MKRIYFSIINEFMKHTEAQQTCSKCDIILRHNILFDSMSLLYSIHINLWMKSNMDYMCERTLGYFLFFSFFLYYLHWYSRRKVDYILLQNHFDSLYIEPSKGKFQIYTVVFYYNVGIFDDENTISEHKGSSIYYEKSLKLYAIYSIIPTD